VGGAVKAVDEDRPGERLVALVGCGVGELVLERLVGAAPLAGVRLADEDVEEADAVAVVGVDLLERRDPAGRERSGVAAEVEEDGRAAEAAKADALAVGGGQLEVGRRPAGRDAGPLNRADGVGKQVTGAEVGEVVAGLRFDAVGEGVAASVLGHRSVLTLVLVLVARR
jgi:hypothetical protein